MSTVLAERTAAHVATVTLNRPKKLNALSAEMFFDLRATLDDLDADPDVRAVVLTGAGRGFCAGHDLNDVNTITDLPVSLGISQIEKEIGCITRVHDMSKPVIAAVNGVAFGGGLSLATASTLRIASESARFGVAFINLDLSGADAGLSWTLPRLVGYGAATELMLTGRVIDADEALRIDLVNQVVPDEKLLDVAHELAAQIVVHAPLALRLTQESIAASASLSFGEAVALEARSQMMSLMSPEASRRRQEFLSLSANHGKSRSDQPVVTPHRE